MARCMLSPRAASATSPPCSSRPSSASISWSPRRCWARARIVAWRRRAARAVPQRGDQRPAAELVVGGDRPETHVRAERGDLGLAQAAARRRAARGRADAAVRGAERARARAAQPPRATRRTGRGAAQPRDRSPDRRRARPGRARRSRAGLLGRPDEVGRRARRRRRSATASSPSQTATAYAPGLWPAHRRGELTRRALAPREQRVELLERRAALLVGRAMAAPRGSPATSAPPRDEHRLVRRRSAGGRRRSPRGSRAGRRRGGSAGSRGGSCPGPRCAARRRGRAPAATRALRARRRRRATSRGSGSRNAGPRRPRRAARCARAGASGDPRPRSDGGSRPRGHRRSPAGRPPARTLRCPRWTSLSSVPGSAGWPPPSSCSATARTCSCSRPKAPARASRRDSHGSSGSPTPTRACARWRWRRASAGAHGRSELGAGRSVGG